MKTNVESTITSKACPKAQEQTSLQLSVPDAVQRLTVTDLQSFGRNAFVAATLVAITQQLVRELTSPDAMWLAMNRAMSNAKEFGVPDDILIEVQSIVYRQWKEQQRSNPLRWH